MRLFRVASLLIALPVLLAAASRHEAVLSPIYRGAHLDLFNGQFDRVRLLVHQAQLEVSSRLGLIQYQQGFTNPIMIDFEDGAPAGLENALAYVRYGGTADGGFQQQMVVNVELLATNPMDFDTVFYHEMTHAVLNDAVGGEATLKIPHWVQEGLAQYVSGEGEERVRKAAQQLRKSQAPTLIFPLEGPAFGNGYPQYYLAIKYLLDKYSVNVVQALVRDLVAGKTPAESIEANTGLHWVEYQENVRAYSLKIFQDLAIPDYLTARPA